MIQHIEAKWTEFVPMKVYYYFRVRAGIIHISEEEFLI
jgi:hypothetical protein